MIERGEREISQVCPCVWARLIITHIQWDGSKLASRERSPLMSFLAPDWGLVVLKPVVVVNGAWLDDRFASHKGDLWVRSSIKMAWLCECECDVDSLIQRNYRVMQGHGSNPLQFWTTKIPTLFPVCVSLFLPSKVIKHTLTSPIDIKPHLKPEIIYVWIIDLDWSRFFPFAYFFKVNWGQREKIPGSCRQSDFPLVCRTHNWIIHSLSVINHLANQYWFILEKSVTWLKTVSLSLSIYARFHLTTRSQQAAIQRSNSLFFFDWFPSHPKNQSAHLRSEKKSAHPNLHHHQ